MPPKSKRPRAPAPPAPVKLTARQRRFVAAYVAKPNGAEAAKLAGYSEHTAKQYAYQLLQRPEIQDEIRRHQETDEKLTGGYRHYVRNAFKELADRGLKDPAHGRTATRALSELAKLEGLYPREGIDIRVQGALEDLVEGVRPLMPAQSYADLLTALAEVTGVARVAPAPDARSGPDAVH